ncbi:MAG: DNA polymerase/3'-5' exonuclease PolX [Chitinophagaceae bacterium]|jgi:DNA polymerase (family 10)|nr:DNA polymerase/3'-5' exonuclease PolX [Chitinophagaceae bacterium]
MENYEISDQFSLLAKLMDVHGENAFKSKSYSIAAFNIEKIEIPIRNIPREKLFSLKGIGESTGKKIIEILDTGELSALKTMIQKTPPGILEMMNIKGIGPKKINVIWKQLEIESLGELLYACNENRLLLYKGFGEKTQTNISHAIEFYMNNQGSYLFAQIEKYALQMDAALNKEFKSFKIQQTGLIRRQMETIDLIEWCTTAPHSFVKEFFSSNNFELIQESEDHQLFKGVENVEIKIHLTAEDHFHQQVFASSCSQSFLEAWIKEFPLSNKIIESEETIFQQAGIEYIPAYLREDPVVIHLAKNKKLPIPLSLPEVCGLIHSHSNWSDGVHTIEEMAEELIKKNFEYLVISDHSKSAFYAKGLSHERIIAQHQYIDELNARYTPFRIFKSIECDILNDGTLDYTDDILTSFDLVIASVHSNLKMTEEKAMTRLIKAIENPYVIILGHMTGRLLLSRNGYPVDHKKIIDACAANYVAIELNAHPRRLDMDWRWIRYALEKEVMISLDPDAHDLEGFDDIRYGVLSAQKAGLTKENNLSSFSLARFEFYLTETHKRKGIN